MIHRGGSYNSFEEMVDVSIAGYYKKGIAIRKGGKSEVKVIRILKADSNNRKITK